MSEPQSARGKMFGGAGSNTGNPDFDAQPPEAPDEERRAIKRRNDAEAEEAKSRAEAAREEHQPPNPQDKVRKPGPGEKLKDNGKNK